MKKIEKIPNLREFVELSDLIELTSKPKIKDYVKLKIKTSKKPKYKNEKIIDIEDEKIDSINKYINQFENSINLSCLRKKSVLENNVNNKTLIQDDDYLLSAINEISTLFNKDNQKGKV